MNSRKCASCGLVNFATEVSCRRCGAALAGTDEAAYGIEDTGNKSGGSIVKRALVVLGVTCLLLFIFYVSLLSTSDRITFEQKQLVYQAINLLDQNGFGKETFALRHLVNYRATDNWWNRWVGHKEAYAATNFPFQVVTLYPDFFAHPADDTERAVILLHEAYHLAGSGEERAFAGVWSDKQRLGWTEEEYGRTRVWRSVREFTAQHAPALFRCGEDGRGDCLEEP